MEELKKAIDDLKETVRLMQQEINYIKSCSAPLELVQKEEELRDAVYNCQTRMSEVEAKVKRVTDKSYQLVTLVEAQNIYKISGVSLAELGEHLHMDTSSVSRVINGMVKKDDFITYHKIKEYCHQKIHDERKRLEERERKKREENASLSAKVS